MSDELLRRLVTDRDVIADPYPLLAELRETAPVHKLGFADYWILTRFEDCRAVLRDQRLGKPEPGDLVPSLVGSPTRDAGGDRSMLFVNPPDHTRLRSLVSRAFTPRRVELLRTSIETMTGELLDDLAGSGGGDLMARLAFPLPANVIGELVGIPRNDRDWLRPLILDLAATLEPGRGPTEAERAKVSRDKVRAYLHELIHRRRAEPADDLLSGLIAAADGGDRLSVGEMVMTVILIYGAGFETTTNLIGNMVHTLLRNPEQLAGLRADRSLVPTAVEEVLRFEPPVHVDSRYAFEDVEMAGHLVAQGLRRDDPAGGGQPRPVRSGRAGPFRRGPQRGSPALVLVGDPLLPRSLTGPTRGSGRAGRPARPLRDVDAAGGDPALEAPSHPEGPRSPARRPVVDPAGAVDLPLSTVPAVPVLR